MATELKDLMDRAVTGLSLPAHLAQNAANHYERGRRRRHRVVAAFATVSVAVTGLIVWLVVGQAAKPGVSTVIPVSPGPVTTSNPRPVAPPATVTVVTTREWFPNGQASLDPPIPAQVPADPTTAWNRIASTLPGNPCGGAKATTVQFGLLTYSTDYNKIPEWVLRCVDIPAPIGAGPVPLNAPVPQASANPEPTTVLEDFISVFDARTGKLLLGWNEAAS